MIACRAAFALTLLIGFIAVPAQADGTHPLPFWGEPYPSGYVRHESGCVVARRVETRHGARTAFIDRCHAVLHARD